MKILATYNIKGGVGKTAAAVNLAYYAAWEGARTLVWDLDPQGAATFYFRIKPKVKGGARGLVTGKKDVDDLIKGTDYDNLDVLPADFSYRNMDLALDDVKKSTRNLAKRLKPLAAEYDYVIMDCPPSISLVSENVFHAAEALLIPLIPTTLSLRTLHQLIDFVDDSKVKHTALLPFFSMVDRRKRLHREITESLPREQPGMLRTQIPYASSVEQMGVHRAVLGSFAPRCPSAEAYQTLWSEIRERLG
jgi:cellulose biosynthesis protein BcsQ